ncbi:hypothetical protein FM113_07015 [Leucobacter sp. 7(1)]|nr:hypothetical protein FM113_07015 [Leucobacter sp. 7(1)]
MEPQHAQQLGFRHRNGGLAQLRPRRVNDATEGATPRLNPRDEIIKILRARKVVGEDAAAISTVPSLRPKL